MCGLRSHHRRRRENSTSYRQGAARRIIANAGEAPMFRSVPQLGQDKNFSRFEVVVELYRAAKLPLLFWGPGSWTIQRRETSLRGPYRRRLQSKNSRARLQIDAAVKNEGLSVRGRAEDERTCAVGKTKARGPGEILRMDGGSPPAASRLPRLARRQETSGVHF